MATLAEQLKGSSRGKTLTDQLSSSKPKATLAERLKASKAAPPEAGGGFLETATGAGRMAVDILSRPNYAVAGAAEELFSPQGGGGMAALKRAGTELASGIGGLQGQKEGFGQVMEQGGVGELGRLSDVLGAAYSDTGEGWALQKGGWADPTGRGAIGLGLDIVSDPTTYLTAGGSSIGKFAASKGTKFLSKEGLEASTKIAKNYDTELKAALAIEEPTARIAATRAVKDKIETDVLSAVEKNPALLQKTGIKFAGQEIVSPETLKGLTDTAKKVVTSVPVAGPLAAKGAEKLARGIQRVWDPYADLAGLPDDMRDAMKGILRQNRSAAAMHKTILRKTWSEIEPEWYKAAKVYGKGDDGIQALGKRFADWREQTAQVVLTPEEQAVFGKLAKFYDDSEAIALKEGLITPEQAAKYSGKYLHHEWKNPEVLSETAKRAGRPAGQPIATESIQRSREFDTLAEGRKISKELHEETMGARQAGLKGKVYGELIPEYDAMKNLGSYIEQLTDGVWRKKTYQEAREKLGLVLDDFDPNVRYAVDNPAAVKPHVRQLVDSVADEVEKLGFRDFKATAQALPNLSPQEQAEMVRELVSRAKSPSQIVNIRNAVGDTLMPTVRVTQPGQVEPYFAKLGQDGTLVSRQGGLWGDKEILIPAQVAKMVEDAPRDIVMDAARRVGLQGMVQAWDKYNNLFKAVTYPFYPSGAARDTYNNIMQAYLGIGVGAFARPGQAVKALRGGDDILRLGEREFTAKEINTLAKDLGVVDPSGTAYVQLTGEGAERATKLAKARAMRGQVDNLTRTQLFINNIAAGMSPEDAAQVVKDFLFDYGELSAFDRDVMRRIIPFGVFPRKAIESTGRAIIKTPGRVANLVKPFRGREDENNMLTSWEGEGFKVRLDRDGKTLTMLNGVDIPIRSLDVLWRGNPKKTWEGLIGMMGPGLKVPYMAASGRDPFRGQEFQRQQYYTGEMMKHAPVAIQKWAGWKEERDAAGRPKYTMRQDRIQVLAEMVLLSRVLSTSERAFREQAREPSMAARLLDVMTGFRLKSLNLDEENEKNLKNKERILQEESVKQGDSKVFRKVYQ